MAKNSIRDYSATASSNTDVQSVNIDENCPASGINNAIREVMADLKDVSTGAVALESPAFDSASLTGDLTFGDNDKAIFGAGSDLQIYHNGSNSFIDEAGTGDLFIRSNSGVNINKYTGETMIYAVPDGAVYLYHNNVQKLATTASGCDVSGSPNILSTTANMASFRTTNATTGYIEFEYNTSTDLGYIGNGSGILTGAAATDFIMRSENDIVFATGGNNSRMQLDSSHGNLMIGTTNSQYNGIGAPAALTSFNNGSRFGANFGASTTGGQYAVVFSNPNGQIGGVFVSGSATSYVTSSDYRLKTEVTYDWDATTRLKQLKPARFKWIADGDDAVFVDGFLAHECGAVPESITGEKDAVDDDGKIIPQGIDQSKIVPLLTKALIEAVEKIEALEARITALEEQDT